MKHHETEYCTGCQVEVSDARKMIIHLLGRLERLEATVDPATLGLISEKKLNMEHSPKGLTASIRMPKTSGDVWMENRE